MLSKAPSQISKPSKSRPAFNASQSINSTCSPASLMVQTGISAFTPNSSQSIFSKMPSTKPSQKFNSLIPIPAAKASQGLSYFISFPAASTTQTGRFTPSPEQSMSSNAPSHKVKPSNSSPCDKASQSMNSTCSPASLVAQTGISTSKFRLSQSISPKISSQIVNSSKAIPAEKASQGVA